MLSGSILSACSHSSAISLPSQTLSITGTGERNKGNGYSHVSAPVAFYQWQKKSTKINKLQRKLGHHPGDPRTHVTDHTAQLHCTTTSNQPPPTHPHHHEVSSTCGSSGSEMWPKHFIFTGFSSEDKDEPQVKKQTYSRNSERGGGRSLFR